MTICINGIKFKIYSVCTVVYLKLRGDKKGILNENTKTKIRQRR